MMYEGFHCTVTGKSHTETGKICQDCSVSGMIGGGITFAAVADGHGNPVHFRSDRGSAIACQCFQEVITAMLPADLAKTSDRDERLKTLKAETLQLWKTRVMNDVREHPFTDSEEELLVSRFGQKERTEEAIFPIAYGSTLCAAWAGETEWEAIQIGDGALTVVDREGHYLWPMPPSKVNEGNKTASLCMNDPMPEFRHCGGNEMPAAIMAFTDGIEKLFPEQGMDLISLLYWILQNRISGSQGDETLRRNMEMLTNRGFTGDDVSIAGLTDRNAEVLPPVYTGEQLALYRQRVTARIEAAENTIRYNRDCLDRLLSDRQEEKERIQEIINRKQEELSLLLQQKEMILRMGQKG